MLYTEQVLTAAERTIMWTPVRLNDKSGAPYGFGWNVDRAGGQRRIWHGGGLPGFVSNYVRFPEEGVTVIALTNGEDTDIRGIANGVASLYSEQARAASGAKR
jgi:CubicO group peptidase (beta-lactamase class C family)